MEKLIHAGSAKWNWKCVPEGGGVFAIRSRSTEKVHIVGSQNLRQRSYDAHRLLLLGTHHNRELQAAWSKDSSDFEFVLLEVVRYPPMLKIFKQVWIERSPTTFNQRNAIPFAKHRAERVGGFRPSPVE